MRKSKLFTPAMDEMIKELYPNIGGAKTAQAINDKFIWLPLVRFGGGLFVRWLTPRHRKTAIPSLRR